MRTSLLTVNMDNLTLEHFKFNPLICDFQINWITAQSQKLSLQFFFLSYVQINWIFLYLFFIFEVSMCQIIKYSFDNCHDHKFYMSTG